MLAIRTGTANLRLDEVNPELLSQAASRKGSWEIKVFERGRTCVGRLVSYTARYSEEEYSKLTRTIYHGHRNNTKSSQFLAGLENAAQTLWPSGSFDHVAMRHVGVAIILRYMTREVSADAGLLSAIARMFGVPRKLPQLRRLRDGQNGPDNNSSGSQSSPPPPSPPTGGPPSNGSQPASNRMPAAANTTDIPAGSPPVMDTPSLPEDAANAAEASEDMRTLVRGDVVAVLGQNFDKEAPVDHLPIVGAMVGPCQVKPNVYSNTKGNLKDAINERITKKAVDPKLTKEEKRRIGSMVNASISNHKRRGVWTKERIQQWATDHFDMEAIKSGKWSSERFRASLENLYSKESPSFRFKANIKAECMPEGKAPRMLIADGDDGCLMALAVVRCFDDIMFDHFENKSIKHLAKRDAVGRAVSELKKKGAGAIEGDGSAWDTTCNSLIRSLVESPVLWHICEILCEYGVIPSSWMEEHSQACDKKKLKLFFENKFETMSVTIDAIRRSGHRGTSSLNWWMNFVMWTCSVFKVPARFLDPEIRRGEDLTGQSRWWNGCFEGDDSLCTMKPPMKPDDALSKVFLAFWGSAGFRMKIVFCTTRATFVGWHIGCTDGELNDFRCPELPRALANSGVSVSSEATKAARTGDRRAVEVLAAASALGRACDFSGILPSVSEKYLHYADSLCKSDFQDREMSIRSHGEEGFGAKEVRERIQENNLGVTLEDEQETLKALGYAATDSEIDTFKEYIWSLDPLVLTDYDSFRRSLPPTWRADNA